MEENSQVPKWMVNGLIHMNKIKKGNLTINSVLFEFVNQEVIPGTNIDIEDFFVSKSNGKNSILTKNFNFIKVDKKRFPIIKLQSRINEYSSTPIIVNAANGILVDQYLKQKIAFSSFYKHLLMVLNDRNYKKYAIKEPKNISQIYQIDKWARNLTYEKLQQKKNA